jgi:hypothetical protein
MVSLYELYVSMQPNASLDVEELSLGIVLALFPLIDKLGYLIGVLPFGLVYVFYRMIK